MEHTPDWHNEDEATKYGDAKSKEYAEAYAEGVAGNRWGSELLARHPDWTGTGGAINGHEAGWADYLAATRVASEYFDLSRYF